MTLRATLPLNQEPVEKCQRWIGSDGYLICDRCGSMWSPMTHNTGWLPLSCPDRIRANGESTQ